MSLHMIALDAQRRAHQTSVDQTSAGQIHSSYVDVCHQQLADLVDVQQEVIIETTPTTDCVQHQPVMCTF